MAEDADPLEHFQQWLALIETIRILFGNNIKLYVLGLYYPKSHTRFFNRIQMWNQRQFRYSYDKNYITIPTDTIMTEPEDICYKIEPSEQGGSKIADQIAHYLFIY